MNLPEVIISQYQACLEMLRQVMVKCPDSIWSNPDDRTPFWQIAYHALFFTHLYLQESEESFTPWLKHREDYQFLGQKPWPPFEDPTIHQAYDRDDLLEYLTFCQGQVQEMVPQTDLEGPSGFDWLPFSKLELQFYTIRHIQLHTGELMERLGSQSDVDLVWVGIGTG